MRLHLSWDDEALALGGGGGGIPRGTIVARSPGTRYSRLTAHHSHGRCRRVRRDCSKLSPHKRVITLSDFVCGTILGTMSRPIDRVTFAADEVDLDIHGAWPLGPCLRDVTERSVSNSISFCCCVHGRAHVVARAPESTGRRTWAAPTPPTGAGVLPWTQR